MNLVFIADETYALPTRAAIRSVIQNAAGEEEITVHVIGVEISEAIKKQFEDLGTERVKIHITNADHLFSTIYKPLNIKHSHVSKAALLKFEIANIFQDLDKFLYLDCDVIVAGDIREFYNTDLTGFYAGATKDYVQQYKKPSHLRQPPFDIDRYFNSGVLLLNLKKMREDGIPGKLLEHRIHYKKKTFLDQDTLNVIFAGKVQFVHPSYNFLTTYWERPEILDASEYKQTSSITAPAIIHYASSLTKKPWIRANTPKVDVFTSYLSEDEFQLCRTNWIKTLAKQAERVKAKARRRKKRNFSYYFHKISSLLFYQKTQHKRIFKLLGIRLFSLKLNRAERIFGTNLRHQEILCPFPNRNRYYIEPAKIDPLLHSFHSIGLHTGEPREKKIIVSLTSFPQRMSDIHYCLYSLLNQDLKPDKVILYLGEEKFPNRKQDIPETILRLKSNGLSIHWCSELRSYTKLIPALKEYPDDIIVTADDDMFYPNNWLEKLYRSYEKEPSCIHAHVVKQITFGEEGTITPHRSWPHPEGETAPSCFHFFEGVGGVLYPPHSLSSEVFNQQQFLELCPLTDDLWFWAMAVLAGTKVCAIPDYRSYLIYTNLQRGLQQTDEPTLSRANFFQGGNDRAIAAIVAAYPQLLNVLATEAAEVLARYEVKNLAKNKPASPQSQPPPRKSMALP